MGDPVGLDDGQEQHFQMSKLFVTRSAGVNARIYFVLSRFGMSGANVARRSSTFGLPEHEISVVSQSLPNEYVAFLHRKLERIPKSTLVPSVIA